MENFVDFPRQHFDIARYHIGKSVNDMIITDGFSSHQLDILNYHISTVFCWYLLWDLRH